MIFSNKFHLFWTELFSYTDYLLDIYAILDFSSVLFKTFWNFETLPWK